jgi:hypothetical protein
MNQLYAIKLPLIINQLNIIGLIKIVSLGFSKMGGIQPTKNGALFISTAWGTFNAVKIWITKYFLTGKTASTSL